jgi:myo-inositol-1(or 4)-monophosphatase
MMLRHHPILCTAFIFGRMQFEKILNDVLPVVESTAMFIRSHTGKVADEEIEIKSRNSLVSFVDKQAEKELVNGLSRIIPGAGFITEEGTTDQRISEYTWIVDPLDGTTNFLHQIPFYSISVGLQHHNELVLGIVFDVVQREAYYAWKGGGAWCNGRQIHTSDCKTIADAVVVTGFPYTARNVVPQLIHVFEYFVKNATALRRLGSAALDLAYVAGGRLDIYYETSLNAWDIAAGILLVREAGGQVSDFHGKDSMMKSGQILAVAPAIYPEVLREMQRLYPL